MTSNEAQPGLLGRTIRRRWRAIIAVCLLGSAAMMAAAYFSSPPTYRAVSLLRVDPMATDLYNIRKDREDLDAYLSTQVQLITSPNVLSAAGTNPKVVVLPRLRDSKDHVAELRKAIRVVVIPGTYLLEVSMRSRSASEAATIVNAVVAAFLEANVEWSDGMTRTQIKNLETYLADLRNQSDEIERRWKELVARGEKDGEVIGLAEADKPANGEAGRPGIPLELYRRLQQEIVQVHLDQVQAEAYLEAMKTATKQAAQRPDPALDQALLHLRIQGQFADEPEVVELQRQLTEARGKVELIRRQSRQAGDPAEKVARVKLDALQAKYQELWDARSRALRGQIELTALKGPDLELIAAEIKVEALRIRQEKLRAEFNNLKVSNNHQANDEVEIALIREQRESLRSMMETVNRRLEQLKFEAKGEARIRPVNSAIPPGKAERDVWLAMILAVIPFGMLFTSFGLFMAVEACSGPASRPLTLPRKSEPDPEPDR